MLISSILVAIIYVSFLLLNRQFRRYQTASSSLQEFILCKKAIQLDVERSALITDSLENSLILKNDLASNDPIIYHFFKSGIVRTQISRVDSFKINVEHFSISHVNETLPLVLQVKLQVKDNADHYSFGFIKRYSAQQLIQAEKSFNE